MKSVDALVPTSAVAAAPPTALSSGAVVEFKFVGRFSVAGTLAAGGFSH